jgi:hypothetical protein
MQQLLRHIHIDALTDQLANFFFATDVSRNKLAVRFRSFTLAESKKNIHSLIKSVFDERKSSMNSVHFHWEDGSQGHTVTMESICHLQDATLLLLYRNLQLRQEKTLLNDKAIVLWVGQGTFKSVWSDKNTPKYLISATTDEFETKW